jgi:hypothetical protein
VRQILRNEPDLSEDLQPIAYTLVGGFLLFCGFLAQLFGYFAAYHEEWYLLFTGAVVAVISGAVGAKLAQHKIALWLQSQARKP